MGPTGHHGLAGDGSARPPSAYAFGTRSRASAAGADTYWGRAWSGMRILGEVHGAENVRLVAWFH